MGFPDTDKTCKDLRRVKDRDTSKRLICHTEKENKYCTTMTVNWRKTCTGSKGGSVEWSTGEDLKCTNEDLGYESTGKKLSGS